MYFLIANPFVWKSIFSQEFIIFSFELCVFFIVYVTCFCHVFLFLNVTKMCVYRVHASNKGHGLRVKLYHTSDLLRPRLKSFSLCWHYLDCDFDRGDKRFFKPAIAPRSACVCVLKGIPPLSLVADSDCRLDKSCGRPRLRGVKTWVRFGGLWDVYVPSEDGDEREGAVCLRNAW